MRGAPFSHLATTNPPITGIADLLRSFRFASTTKRRMLGRERHNNYNNEEMTVISLRPACGQIMIGYEHGDVLTRVVI